MSDLLVFITLMAPVGLVACGGGSSTCDPADFRKGCEGGKVCEQVGAMPACVEPVVVKGRVLSTAGAPVAEALVQATDANDAPASGAVRSGAMGEYELTVPTPRGADGAPLARQIKLRASGAGYATFPSGIQRALPIELTTAAAPAGGKRVVQSTATDVTLTALPSPAGLGAIAGTVKAGAGKSGALVVAEGEGKVFTAISDLDGSYQIFNVASGSYTVAGYAAGLKLAPASAAVTAGATATADLAVAQGALGSVAGSVSIVNAPGGSMTSVVLVVESTFNAALARGEVPPGLRAPRSGPPSVTGAFTIDGVPDGKYVVLAAFENDGLVRDPDTSIGGTQIQHVTVAGAPVPLSAGFKVTEALTVVSPGGGELPDAVSVTPTFVWKDDSSEDKYTVEVFDAKGEKVWGPTDVPAVTGGANVSVAYAGPALSLGGYYQFRATSFRKGKPISQTEDLKGVFIVK